MANIGSVYVGVFFVFPEISPDRHFNVDDETHDLFMDSNEMSKFSSAGSDNDEYIVTDKLDCLGVLYIGNDEKFAEFGIYPAGPEEQDSKELADTRARLQPKLQTIFDKYSVPIDLDNVKVLKYYWIRPS